MRKIRDLERTREAIFKAGLAEFAAKGLAGARTEAIARRAGVNKRMLFYCFGSKEGLYREVLKRKLDEKGRVIESLPDDIGAGLLQMYDAGCADVEWVPHDGMGGAGVPPIVRWPAKKTAAPCSRPPWPNSAAARPAGRLRRR